MFIFIWLLFCLFSFSRQDLNLTLYNFSFWNPIRTWLQALTNFQVTIIFLILALLLTIAYFRNLPSTPGWKHLIILIIPALITYPLFSHDLFNYLFNAKMVLIYHLNPHLQTAQQFIADPVLRFMHNVHTPAPYAYGWTAMSLIPGLVWFSQNFTLSFWAMKLFVACFFLLQLIILKKLVSQLFPQEPWRWWLLALNPLVLIETLINGHNDVVMMSLALLSYWFFLNQKQLKSVLFLLLSASTKYVTILLLPFYILKNKFKNLDLPMIFSLLLLLVMLIRPDQLHSWYLIWSFSFAVLSKNYWLISFITALSLGALFRYAPYLYFGNWDPPVYLLRNLIWLVSLGLAPLIRKKMLK